MQGLPRWLSGKEPACQEVDTGSTPGSEDPLHREMATHSMPGKSHGQRSLVGYHPWGCKRVRHDLVTK